VAVYIARPGHEAANRLLCLFGEPQRISGGGARHRSNRSNVVITVAAVTVWLGALGLICWFARSGLHWGWTGSLRMCTVSNGFGVAIVRKHTGSAKLYNRLLWRRCERHGHLIRVPDAYVGPFRKQADALGMAVGTDWSPRAPRCLSTILNPYFVDIEPIMTQVRILASPSGLSATSQHRLRRSIAQSAAALAVREDERYRSARAHESQLMTAFRAGLGLTSGQA